MEVGDHDFTHFSVVPSLSLILDIPDTVEESWYRVQVMVTGVDLGFSQGGGGGGGANGSAWWHGHGKKEGAWKLLPCVLNICS